MEAVHECRKTLVGFAGARGAAEQAEVYPRVQPEQESLDASNPVLGKKVAQDGLLLKSCRPKPD